MAKTVSIIGLGWLGLPLAISLLEKGFKVKGTVTTASKTNDIERLGIDVSVLKINTDGLELTDRNLFKADILFINIPPGRIPEIEMVYPSQIRQLLPFIDEYKIRKVIFISSTSVYPENNKVVTEDDSLQPEKGSGVACLTAEHTLQNEVQFSTTVVRFGGLIGADRNPYRFMQRSIKNGPANKPVNLIHLDDCIGIIHHVIKNDIWSEVINACCPIHPTRAEFYTEASKSAGVDPPIFDENIEFKFKIVSSEKLIYQYRYAFKYNSPMDYLKTI